MTTRLGLSRIGFLARLVRQHWLLFAGDLITGVVFFLCALIPGLALREFLNALPVGSPGAALPLLPLLAFVAFKIANAVGAAAWMAVDTVFRFRIYDDVRMRLSERLLARPGALPPPVPAGDLLSRYRDDTVEVAEVLGKRGIQLVTSSIALSGTTFAVLFSISLQVTVLAVLPTLIIAVIAFLASKKLKEYQHTSRRTAGDVSGFLRECFAGIEMIKVNNARRSITARARVVNDRRRHAAVVNQTFGEVLASSQNVVIVLGTALVMLVAASQITAGTFRVGDFAYFVYALGSMGTLVDAVGRFVSRFQRFSVTTTRLSEVLVPASLAELTTDPPPRPAPHPVPTETDDLLTVTDLCYDHPDNSPGLRDISFSAGPGDLVLITGPVGSGKTTLVRAILGVLPPSSGTVIIDGHRCEPGGVFAPPLASYTPQAPHVFSDTLAENILLGAPDERCRPALVRSTLDVDLPRLENGIDTVVGPRGQRISGGQLHRLAAARMFAHPATVWLIDDLSASLDVATERILLDNLVASHRDGVLVVVSNRPMLRDHATQILILADGRVAN